eukprot:3435633-Rhodomonas_salina.1
MGTHFKAFERKVRSFSFWSAEIVSSENLPSISAIPPPGRYPVGRAISPLIATTAEVRQSV